ncbi:MAG: TIGR03621 family F420-dependent LLM class oxidoreductase, partial [Nocardioidaceae bacterium]|nr:TIGR03621 family F420-dependent LLM class oxidoreductase [Nocardioidaceae bacterium]
MLPFRFGVVFTGHYDRRAWTDLARRVEGTGFSTLLVADHYVNPMACGPLLMAAAAVTTELRIGSYVYNNDFRPPALLAKEAATIDVLSGGRLELGIGAGWSKVEYVAAGVRFDPPGVRVSRFEEALGIVRALLAGETVDHRGEHYRVRGLLGSPRTVQQPVPLLVGGGGRRMVGLAAQHADIIGFVPQALPEGGLDSSGITEAWMETRIGWLEQHLVVNARTCPLERSVLLFGIGGSAHQRPDLGHLDPGTLASSPFALVGDTGQMVEALIQRRERWGLSYVVCFDEDMQRLEPV